MRCSLLAAAVALGLAWITAGALHAGVYNTAEPPILPLPGSFAELSRALGELRSVAVEGRPEREIYLKKVADLEAKEQAGELTVEERINLGAYYIRLMKYDAATRTLMAADAQEPDNFMVLSNLATANQLADRLDRAIVYLEQALKVWPRVQAGFTSAQLDQYRRAEHYQLNLLQLRQQESRLRTGQPINSVDAIFPQVRFVGPSGQYEAGVLAPEQWDQMPYEAMPATEMLVLWLPFDDRLYWLLGEMLNAEGNIESAAAVMDELVNARRFSTARELVDHRRAVVQAWRQLQPAAAVLNGLEGAGVKEQLLWAVAPRPGPMMAGAGGAFSEMGWAVALDHLARNGAYPAPALSPTVPSKTSTSPAPSALPDWRTLVVGMVVGAVLALLFSFQWRQARQRVAAGVRGRG